MGMEEFKKNGDGGILKKNLFCSIPLLEKVFLILISLNTM